MAVPVVIRILWIGRMLVLVRFRTRCGVGISRLLRYARSLFGLNLARVAVRTQVKNYTLMPYRTKTERISVCRKRPGWIQQYGNAYNENDMSTNTGGFLAVHKMGGITTMVKTIEIVGELVNDATAAPNVELFNSPIVLELQHMISFECATVGNLTVDFVAGDPTFGTPTSALTGQPWNYMYPTPSSSSSLGTSAVIGALTSGL